MSMLGRILIVEDDPRDVELTLAALEEYHLTNEVVVTRDGQQALDYLYCRGQFDSRSNENPAVMLLDLKLPKIDGLEVLQQNQVRRSSQGDTRGGADVVPRGKGHDEKLQARGERLRRKAGRFSRICQCRQGTGRVLGDRE
jgi:CheY-like chemotaxis protein